MNNLPSEQSLKGSSSFIVHSTLSKLFDLLEIEASQSLSYKNIGSEDNPDFIESINNDGIREFRKKHIKSFNDMFASLFQANELYFKSIIARTNPKELIESEKGNDFLKSKTIDSSKLLGKIKELNSESEISKYFLDNFERNRLNRNAIIHCFKEITPINTNDILSLAFEILKSIEPDATYFNSRNDFFEEYEEFDKSSTHINLINYDLSYAFFISRIFKEFTFIINEISPSTCKKYLAFDMKKNRYLCPCCLRVLTHELSYEVDANEDTPRTLVNFENGKFICLICQYEVFKITNEKPEECIEYEYSENCILDVELSRCIVCGCHNP